MAAPVPLPPPPDDGSPIVWDAPAACGDRDGIVAAVEEQLGRPWEGDDVQIVARVVEEHGGGYALELRTERDGIADTRNLAADDCDALLRATALIVALSVDPVAVAEHFDRVAPAVETPSPPTPVVQSPRSEPASSPQPPVTRAIRRPPTAADAARPAQARPGFSIAVDAGGELGALPGPTGIAGLSGAVLWPALRVELGGAYAVPRTEVGQGADVRVMMGVVAARACWRLRQPKLEVPLCGGMEGGVLRGDGRRAPDARTAHGRLVGVAASVGVVVPVAERVTLRGRAEAVTAVVRPSFEVRDPGDPATVFAPSVVSGRVWLGLEIKIVSPRDRNTARRRRD